MSGGGEQSQVTEQIRGLIDQWTASLAEVVASMADQKPEVRWDVTGAPPAGPDLLWWEQPFQIGPGAAVWVATPRSTWEYAGTLTLKAAGLETVETNEARNTWLEILGQSLSGLARAIGGVLGKEVTCEAGTERAPETNPETAASVSLAFGGSPETTLWIGFSPKLLALISHPPGSDNVEAHAAPLDAAADAGPRPPRRCAAHHGPAAGCRTASQCFIRQDGNPDERCLEADHGQHCGIEPEYQRTGGGAGESLSHRTGRSGRGGG